MVIPGTDILRRVRIVQLLFFVQTVITVKVKSIYQVCNSRITSASEETVYHRVKFYFTKNGFKKSLQPAIHLATDGFSVQRDISKKLLRYFKLAGFFGDNWMYKRSFA